jgi:Ca-activated chloride channel family protein
MYSPPTKNAVTFILLFLCVVFFWRCRAHAQGMNLAPNQYMNGFDPTRLDMVLDISEDRWQRNLENLSSSFCKLDRKAPNSARREYEKGTRFLIQKNYNGAIEHLTRAVSIYPSFVSAHNALGSAHLNLKQNEQAQTEFAQAVALDGHLPFSYLNLGWAQLALKNFPSAQDSMKKAAKLAPLDLHLLIAQAYAQLLNKDYDAVIATAQQVHSRKHEGAAIVHYFAAASWQGQDNLQQTQNELGIFLAEAPTSPFADAARQMIAEIKDQREHPPAPAVEISFATAPIDPSAVTIAGLPSAARGVFQRMQQERQLAEVEADPERGSVCDTCSETAPRASAAGSSHLRQDNPYILRSSVNEVAVFFAATDHGKSVTDLTQQDVVIQDAGRPPEVVTHFRNESQLPLRLGLVIDTSASITKEFAFEQNAAASFLRKSLTDKHDMAFVVGFANAVLLVQDFTGDSASVTSGIDQLSPGGGTALWDAVKFASDKLASIAEEKPSAKIVVIISDGEDNSSSATLKEAIESAEHGGVTLYTVSTRAFAGGDDLNASTADRSMRALAEQTGGAALFPGSLGDLDRRLVDLQEVIRSRYLISYKPAAFRSDGSYRTIGVVARKSGHKLRVYARRGYYAPTGASEAHTSQLPPTH